MGQGVLDLGGAEGSRFQRAAPSSAAVDPELIAALGPEGSEERAPAERFAAIVADASQATDAVDRARALFAFAAAGNLADRAAINDEITVLLGALNRLDRAGDHAEALELARALASLLALVERWGDLIQTLLTAGKVMPTTEVKGWVLHELGTLSAAAGRHARARHLLRDAYRLRKQVGDHEGAAATAQNLALASARPVVASTGGPFRALRGGCVVGAVAAAIVGGVVVAIAHRAIDRSSANLPTLMIDHISSAPTFSGKYVVLTDAPFHGNLHIATGSRATVWRAHKASNEDGDFVAYGSSTTPPLSKGTYYAWFTQSLTHGNHAVSNVVSFVIGSTRTTHSVPSVAIRTPTDGEQFTNPTDLRIAGSVSAGVGNVIVTVVDASTQNTVLKSKKLGTGRRRWRVRSEKVQGLRAELVCDKTYTVHAVGLTGGTTHPTDDVSFVWKVGCSTGPSPPAQLPNVVGNNLGQAEHELRAAGFKVSVTQQVDCDDLAQDNIVHAQTPDSPTAPQGAVVTLAVTKYLPNDATCGGPPPSS